MTCLLAASFKNANLRRAGSGKTRQHAQHQHKSTLQQLLQSYAMKSLHLAIQPGRTAAPSCADLRPACLLGTVLR